jgi:hypothetical protein
VKRNTLTIEHVMPQGWEAHWPLPAGHTEEDMEARSRLVQTMGNLTLVNNRLNPALSNAAWPIKKAGIADHSVLFLNKDILTRTPSFVPRRSRASGWNPPARRWPGARKPTGALWCQVHPKPWQ